MNLCFPDSAISEYLKQIRARSSGMVGKARERQSCSRARLEEHKAPRKAAQGLCREPLAAPGKPQEGPGKALGSFPAL